ncbi:MAG: hypothetical protein AEth_01172 [Candidatus Argoarchaeum ethanivorans]|uniref:Uncharacterized protein n=1 Tax=Candidatus Argoarchaeum ethanivorans TaxID=2608793 RepID=A0A8B3S356_9EURY|nr:MAG: hypothetical protein AEth_01172 [Candidatus Argoarchaeum ethanivorans]
MDSEIIYQHLEWVKTIESKYKYIEQETESDSEEFAAFFSVAGRVSGAAVGMAIGSWAASGALAAIFHKVGKEMDKKLRL